MFDSSVRSLSNKGSLKRPIANQTTPQISNKARSGCVSLRLRSIYYSFQKNQFQSQSLDPYSAVVASKLGNSEFPSGNCLPSFPRQCFPTSVSSLSSLSLSSPPLLLPLLLHHQPFFSFFMLHLFPLVLLYLPQSASYKYRRFSLSLLSHLPPILSSSSFPSMLGILIILSILIISLIVSLTQLSFISTISYSPLKAAYSQHLIIPQ
jgi:hypothetical protein